MCINPVHLLPVIAMLNRNSCVFNQQETFGLIIFTKHPASTTDHPDEAGSQFYPVEIGAEDLPADKSLRKMIGVLTQLYTERFGWWHKSTQMWNGMEDTTEELKIETFHISNPAASHYWPVVLRPQVTLSLPFRESYFDCFINLQCNLNIINDQVNNVLGKIFWSRGVPR